MEDMELYGSLDLDEVGYTKVDFECPCFVFTEGNDPFAVMYSNLQDGELPIMFDSGESKKVFPKRISGSAYNVQRLLKVMSSLQYYNEKGERFEVHDVKDYLEAVLQ